MTVNTGLMTADELWRLPEDHLRHELVRGRLRTMPLRTMLHGLVTSRFNSALWQRGEIDRHGEVVIGVGCHIVSNPDTVRAPTIAFIRRERLALVVDSEGYFPGAPDLAVEIVDVNDTYMDVNDRVSDWLDHGTQLVFLVNPYGKRVTVFHPDMTGVVLGLDDVLSGEDVVPGWTMSVRELFRSE
jgi:Uma2 family endonuclease